VKQRNAALRQVSRYAQLRPGSGADTAGGANQPLAGRIQCRYRRRHGGYLSAVFTGVALTFSFQRGWEKETDYAEVLERNFERDRMLTYTAHGPHKADFRIRADGAPVEDTLSRGQLKLLMCALRLAQGEFLTRESGRRCLYLIDDFASELDDARRGLLASRLKATQSQVFVSAISAEHVMDMSDENSKMFTVEKGKIAD
jgi:DNA replication and repair protein RecF